jgi:rubredoxin
MVTVDKIRLECPNCHWIFEVKIPDKRHPVASLEKPQKGKTVGDIIEENLVCRNPKCKKPFTIYWFEPIEFFRRI